MINLYDGKKHFSSFRGIDTLLQKQAHLNSMHLHNITWHDTCYVNELDYDLCHVCGTLFFPCMTGVKTFFFSLAEDEIEHL